MKISQTEVAPSGKQRTSIYLGDEEMELLSGLVQSAIMHTPYCTSTMMMHNRLKNMRVTFRKAIENNKDWNKS